MIGYKLLFIDIDIEVAIGGKKKTTIKFYQKNPKSGHKYQTQLHSTKTSKLRNGEINSKSRFRHLKKQNKLPMKAINYVSANENILTQYNNHEAGKHP